MRDAYTPPDNGASYLGKYSVSNELVCWLIGRGQGELVALRPEEMTLDQPLCPDRRCREPMKFRPGYWACYLHKEPIKIRQQLAVQKLPGFPGRLEQALTSIVDMEYAYNPLLGRSEWTYITRELRP